MDSASLLIKASGHVGSSAPLVGGPLAEIAESISFDHDVKVYIGRYSLAASGTASIDLSGALTVAGKTKVFTKIYAVIARQASGSGSVELRQPAANGLSGIFTAAGEGVILDGDGIPTVLGKKSGVAVVAATGDLLELAEVGTTAAAVVDVLIFGE